MDKKIANNFIVGLMFLSGFVAFLFVLFNIGGGGLLRSQFTLYGKFGHVKGLHMGSEVSLSGLRVGVVKELTVTDKDAKEITVEISVSNNVQQYIRKDSVATIRTQGILGDKYIEISIGNESSGILQNGDTILTSEPEDIFSKGGKAVENISAQFSQGGDLDALIKSLNSVARNLAAITGDMKEGKLGASTSDAAKRLDSILKSVEQGEGTLGALIKDPTVYEDIKALTGGAKRSAVLQYFMRQFIDEGAKEEKQKNEKLRNQNLSREKSP